MQTLRNSSIYFLFWMLFFSSDRLFSLIYHFSKSSHLSIFDFLGVFVYGWRMDASISAYISIFPFFLFIISNFGGSHFIKKINLAYTFAILLLCIVLCIIDRGIFEHWGYRLDATPLQFIDTPREMLASLTNKELSLACLGGFFLLVFWCFMATKFLNLLKFSSNLSLRKKLFLSFLQLFLTPFLFLLMRGGWQLLPMNTSLVYFTDNQYANQTAINPIWNFFYTVVHRDGYQKENPYNYFPLEKAAALTKPLLPLPIDTADYSILTTPRPNIVIIIWESLTAKVFEPLGGEKNVTPNLEAIAKEGLLFTNIYANGNRSDKGLPAICSAYPAQPTQSIMILNGKMQKMPHLSHPFKQNGYQPAFYYGGDLNFGNMYAYYNKGEYSPIIGRSNFAEKDMNKKWGASDGAVVRRFLDETPNESDRFFKVLFTLSSHEPFDVPMKSRFEGNNDNIKFKNAHAYTDSCIGALVREAKTRDWWDNTLIVIVADHGHQLPDYQQFGYEFPESFHIPMIFTGGALGLKGKQETFGNQSDLSATLLHQLKWASREFEFSKDLFSKKQPHFAHYIFNEGFGYIDEKNKIVFKHDYDNFIINQQISPKFADQAKAYLEMTYQNFIDK